MSRITLDIPDTALTALRLSPQELAVEMRMSTAAHLYDQGTVSLHQAAEFAGVDEFTFRQRLGNYGISAFHLTKDELLAGDL